MKDVLVIAPEKEGSILLQRTAHRHSKLMLSLPIASNARSTVPKLV
jgi:hypothetical protein